MEVDGLTAARRGISAVLFLQAGMYTMDSMSTLNSSPWTSEAFGADEAKAKAAREYVMHALGVGTVYCAASAVIAGSWWPVAGAAVNAGYLLWIYDRALKRAKDSGSTGWGSAGRVSIW